MDIRAIMLCSVVIKKCHIKGHNILHPFWSGFRCKKYRRDGGADNARIETVSVLWGRSRYSLSNGSPIHFPHAQERVLH